MKSADSGKKCSKSSKAFILLLQYIFLMFIFKKKRKFSKSHDKTNTLPVVLLTNAVNLITCSYIPRQTKLDELSYIAVGTKEITVKGPERVKRS